MLGISKLTAAIRGLADDLAALGETVRQVNHGVRAHLALDHAGDGPPAADVIDSDPQATPAALPPALPPARRNGRRPVA